MLILITAEQRASGFRGSHPECSGQPAVGGARQGSDPVSECAFPGRSFRSGVQIGDRVAAVRELLFQTIVPPRHAQITDLLGCQSPMECQCLLVLR